MGSATANQDDTVQGMWARLPRLRRPLAAAAAASSDDERKSNSKADSSQELLQIWLLAAARCVFQLSRICIGPLMVSMSEEYGYSPTERGNLLAAFAGGYALTQVVGGLVSDRYGGAPVILFGLVTSACGLLLLPWAADTSTGCAWWLLWIMGFTQGPTFPAQMVTTSKWVSGSLRSYASALGAAASTTGSLVALGLTPTIVVHGGWRFATQFMAFATLGYATQWYTWGRSSPAAMSGDVSRKRQSESSGRTEPRSVQTAVRQSLRVLLAVPVLATIGAHSVHNFVRYFLMAWMPLYYSDVLKVPMDVAGVHLMCGEFVGCGVGIAGANVGRQLQSRGVLSALAVRRVFASIAFAGGALGLAIVSAAQGPYSSTAGLCIVQGVASLQGLGWGASYLDVSIHQGGMVTGVGNTVATMASYAAPVFASWVLNSLADNQNDGMSREGWRWLFLAFAASNAVGWTLYVPFCSTRPVDIDEADTQGCRETKGAKAD